MSSRGRLAKKLVKATQVQKLQVEEIPTIQVQDIEDTVAVRSQYFSPIQTRHQRKFRWNPPQRYELPAKKSPIKHVGEITNYGINKTIKLSRSLSSSSDDSSMEDYTPKWEPPYWQDVLENIRIMRQGGDAPVDTMGCDKCSDENADEKTQRFQKLVALMLSSQTKDEVTYKTVQKLRELILTPESIASMGNELEETIHSVSFYRNKAKYLRQTAKILISEFDSDIPFTIRDLISLPGVGPKMAHICMATAWNEITGIGVDVHCHRIANRLRWTPKETKDPEKTRIALEEWLPLELWGEVNHLLVGFGQTICTPIKPRCSDCLNRDMCPSAFKFGTKKTITSSSHSNALKISQQAINETNVVMHSVSPIPDTTSPKTDSEMQSSITVKKTNGIKMNINNKKRKKNSSKTNGSKLITVGSNKDNDHDNYGQSDDEDGVGKTEKVKTGKIKKSKQQRKQININIKGET